MQIRDEVALLVSNALDDDMGEPRGDVTPADYFVADALLARFAVTLRESASNE